RAGSGTCALPGRRRRRAAGRARGVLRHPRIRATLPGRPQRRAASRGVPGGGDRLRRLRHAARIQALVAAMTRLALLLLLLVCSAAAGARPPRETVDAVAAMIEARYFDADRAAVIADGLRAEAGDGTFD